MSLSDNPGSLGARIECRQIDINLSSSWNDIRLAFESIDGLELCQNWLDDADRIEKGIVKVAQNGWKLLVYADFDDSYIFNPAAFFNDPVRPEGDFLEIILKPEGQEPYYELHVTPDNQRSQFKFQRAECAKDVIKANPGKSTVELFGIDVPVFTSKTKIDKDCNKWFVLAEISLLDIIDGDNKRPVNRFFYNFCRKNIYESGKGEYSSTAKLSEFNYHHQNEWGIIYMRAPFSTIKVEFPI